MLKMNKINKLFIFENRKTNRISSLNNIPRMKNQKIQLCKKMVTEVEIRIKIQNHRNNI